MNNYTIDNIAPEFYKAWHYANGFMLAAIKTEDHCRAFVEAATEWNEEEKEFLIWAWLLITTGVDTASCFSRDISALQSLAESDAEEINDILKLALDDCAKEEHDIELDHRQIKDSAYDAI